MQPSRHATIPAGRATPEDDLLEQAEIFEAHWAEVFRFVLNKKLRASMYHGPESELSHAEIAAITVLGDRGFRMSDLASRLGFSESSTTRLVDRLFAAGLVERQASPEDRRSVTAALTEAGRLALANIRAGRREFLRDILAPLPPSERAELVRLFGRVAEELRLREARGEVRA
jgi:DNA-binding MarR family transcriptional regulator